MKYHHGGIQSPISTQSTPPPQFGPPPRQFWPQCPCPGPGIHGMSGPCGLASATPAPSPRAVKPTTPVVAATATISFRFIMHPWCNHLPLRCSSSPIRITRGSGWGPHRPATQHRQSHCRRTTLTSPRATGLHRSRRRPLWRRDGEESHSPGTPLSSWAPRSVNSRDRASTAFAQLKRVEFKTRRS